MLEDLIENVLTVVIRTHERPELLAVTLESVARSYMRPNRRVIVSYDGTADAATLKVIEAARGLLNFGGKGHALELWESGERRGVDAHTKWTFERDDLTREANKEDWVLSLSDDVIVSRPWALILEHWIGPATAMMTERRPAYISGYHGPGTTAWVSEALNRAGLLRCSHAPLLGLVNLPLLRLLLGEYQPGLNRDPEGDRMAWDSYVMRRCEQSGHGIFCTQRSVIQHIGLAGLHGFNNPPADDFIGRC